MTFPFGSWMGTEIQDSFWAPKTLLDEVGSVLEQTDHLRGTASAHEVAVLYPLADAWAGELAGPRWASAGDAVDYSGIPDDQRIAYHGVIRQLALAHVPFDSIPLPDPRYRANDVTSASLAPYRYVVVPDVQAVSPEQHAALAGDASAGGRGVVLGGYGSKLDAAAQGEAAGWLAGELSDPAGAIGDRQVLCRPLADLYVGIFALPTGGQAVHVVNYAYDAAAGQALPRTDVTLKVRLPLAPSAAKLWLPGAEPEPIEIRQEGDHTVLQLPEVRLYAIVELS
jgi:hypothetical protein